MKRLLVFVLVALVSCQSGDPYTQLAKQYLEQKSSYNPTHIPVVIVKTEILDSLYFSFGYATQVSKECSQFNNWVSKELLDAAMAGGSKGRRLASTVADSVLRDMKIHPLRVDRIVHPETVPAEFPGERRKAMKVWFDFGEPKTGALMAILYFDKTGQDIWCDDLSTRSTLDLIQEQRNELSRLFNEALEMKNGW